MNSLSESIKPFTAQLQGSLALQRWRALLPRERLALGLLGLFVLLTLVYVLLLQPPRRGVPAGRGAFARGRALNPSLEAQARLARSRARQPRVSLDPANLQGLVT